MAMDCFAGLGEECSMPPPPMALGGMGMPSDLLKESYKVNNVSNMALRSAGAPPMMQKLAAPSMVMSAMPQMKNSADSDLMF